MTNQRKLSPTGSRLEPLEKALYIKLKNLREKFEKNKLLIGVSGGLDSISLLHVLHALQSRLGYKLHVAHVNHGVRGKEADNDAKFVVAKCKKLKIPCSNIKLKKIPVQASEATLRERRYEVLLKLKEKQKAPFVVVAHHRDDLLETRLMRLIQGTGITGLRAMNLLNDESILRPFIEVPRREIEKYAVTKHLKWRNDATNLDTKKLRNWIRRSWLGVLKRDHPEYIENLFHSLERIIETSSPPPAQVNKPQREFDRINSQQDQTVHSYLRHHGKNRITSRHVAEFKKQLQSPRKQFVFRLAGVNWIVKNGLISPQIES